MGREVRKLNPPSHLPTSPSQRDEETGGEHMRPRKLGADAITERSTGRGTATMPLRRGGEQKLFLLTENC